MSNCHSSVRFWCSSIIFVHAARTLFPFVYCVYACVIILFLCHYTLFHINIFILNTSWNNFIYYVCIDYVKSSKEKYQLVCTLKIFLKNKCFVETRKLVWFGNNNMLLVDCKDIKNRRILHTKFGPRFRIKHKL